MLFIIQIQKDEPLRLPVDFKIIAKTEKYTDEKTKKEKRRSEKTKNEMSQDMVSQSLKNEVKYTYVLAG